MKGNDTQAWNKKLSIVRNNILANMGGQTGVALLTIFSTPAYFSVFGNESYGIILFAQTLLTVVAFVDLGLSTSLARKLAEAGYDRPVDDQSNAIFTFSSIYYSCVSLAVGGAMFFGAGLIVHDWLTVPVALQNDAMIALKVWAFAMMLRMPITLLTGVLTGMQRQVQLNLVSFLSALFRVIVSLSVAKFFNDSIVYFAFVYLIVTLLELLAMLRFSLAGGLLKMKYLAVDKAQLASFGRFSVGVWVTTVMAWLIKYFDKVLISGTVEVSKYSIYQATFTLLLGLTLISSAFVRAFYPKLVHAVVNKTASIETFFQASAVISAVVSGVAAFFIFNAEFVVSFWTRIPTLAGWERNFFSVVCIAMLLNASMQMPQYLSWAAGKSRLTAISNTIGVFVHLPILIMLVKQYDVMGGAVAWLIYNSLYFLVFPIFSIRMSLGHHCFAWYKIVLGYIALAFLLTGGFAYFGNDQWMRVLLSGTGVAIYYIICVARFDELRTTVLRVFR